MSKPTIPHGDMMISAEHRSWVEASLNQLAEIDIPNDLAESLDLDDENFWSPEYSWARPYKVRNRALIVPVRGVLLHSFPYSFGGWATGYDYIVAAVRRGANDPNVDRIVLHVNSPGGLVAGCFNAVDEIFNSRGAKPILAVADEAALSGAYAIASAADEIIVARTGQVGSIGVVTAYVEMSRMLDEAGVTVNLIYAGDRKVDGHPTIPMSDEARTRIQTRVNNSYEIFVSTVARNRGLEEDAVRATEADFFTSQEAVEKGLADSVGSLGTVSANAEFSPDQEEDSMSNDNTAVDQAAHQAAVADATTSGRNAGAQAERARVSAILDSEEAKTRPAAARQVALHTDWGVEAAATFLAGMPEESKVKTETQAPAPKATGSGFAQAMTDTGNPELGADSGQASGTAEMSDADVAESIFTSAGHKAR